MKNLQCSNTLQLAYPHCDNNTYPCIINCCDCMHAGTHTHLQQQSHRQTDKHVGAHTLMQSQEHINTLMHGCLHAHTYAHSHNYHH